MATRTETTHRAIEVLQRLSDLVSERREEIARGADLSVPQWRVLEEIATEHFMPSLFARRRAVSPAAVSKLIRGLLERKLIRATIADGDRRQRTYELTAAGRRTLDGIRETRGRAIDAIWRDLPVSELNRFAVFGETLATRLEALLGVEV
ncbi:MAG: MarR family transcriptional regulator [Myxococcota bacterium]|jgi:DNA-binding MarR family transcriptional regulator|nr:MarR family transcriptional regulator [Myxococcota bacterium]